ncbi:MAG: hypothetical protein MRJ93_12980 [Nitrososphaeraceae archaeon]|nr:hypothetical protein [Nitrososphaeraceae archaeon]
MNSDNERHSRGRKQQNRVEWRREQAQLLASHGYSQRDIASKLQVSIGTVNKDISFLREQAKKIIQEYIDEKIPEEYEKCLTGINSILKESWDIANNAKDSREKMQALSLAKDCYSQRLDLLTNSSVISDSIRFIQKSKQEIENISTTTQTEQELTTKF